jgi:hypothetical protein
MAALSGLTKTILDNCDNRVDRVIRAVAARFDDELAALLARAGRLLSAKRFPEPESDQRSFPWPLL